HDGAALRLVIRVPTNAQSFTFNSNFFSFEFPNYICSTYNDTFVVEMAPAPPGASTGGNIAFDQSGNPISVNNALLQVCTAQTAGKKQFTCPLGPAALASTGFASHAATGWLQTQVNIDPSLKGKDITLVFAVWDSGDGILDSSALVDNFQWSTQPGSATPVTQPNPAQ
ncbi:MAG: choice-of-anchor L domain-containing protein, partial [Polyangiaceae bacterium]